MSLALDHAIAQPGPLVDAQAFEDSLWQSTSIRSAG
jgi:hypothetical protein